MVRTGNRDERAVELARRVYRAAALSNLAATAPAFLAYGSYVRLFLPKPPRYPFLVWIWSGMAALWGMSFWEISRDPEGSYRLIKYSYLEKMVTSVSIIVAYRKDQVPRRVVAAAVLTDMAWIPLFAGTHLALRRRKERTSS
jgi:hypothetical protein